MQRLIQNGPFSNEALDSNSQDNKYTCTFMALYFIHSNTKTYEVDVGAFHPLKCFTILHEGRYLALTIANFICAS